MQPMNQLELIYHLKDLERRALRDQAAAGRMKPCLACARMQRATRALVQAIGFTGATAIGRKP